MIFICCVIFNIAYKYYFGTISVLESTIGIIKNFSIFQILTIYYYYDNIVMFDARIFLGTRMRARRKDLDTQKKYPTRKQWSFPSLKWREFRVMLTFGDIKQTINTETSGGHARDNAQWRLGLGTGGGWGSGSGDMRYNYSTLARGPARHCG